MVWLTCSYAVEVCPGNVSTYVLSRKNTTGSVCILDSSELDSDVDEWLHEMGVLHEIEELVSSGASDNYSVCSFESGDDMQNDDVYETEDFADESKEEEEEEEDNIEVPGSDVIEAANEGIEDPGQRVMWFGRFRGTPLNELKTYYIESLNNRSLNHPEEENVSSLFSSSRLA